jgi:lysophospholipase L1-like esterase
MIVRLILILLLFQLYSDPLSDEYHPRHRHRILHAADNFFNLVYPHDDIFNLSCLLPQSACDVSGENEPLRSTLSEYSGIETGISLLDVFISENSSISYPILGVRRGGVGFKRTSNIPAQYLFSFGSYERFHAQDITVWGDSLTGSTEAIMPYPAMLASDYLPGVTVFNGGVNSQTSTQIAVRAGAIDTEVTILGGKIPSSGDVDVQFPVGYEPNNLIWQSPTSGTVEGVSGTIRMTKTSANTKRYIFTRSQQGTPVFVHKAVPFVVDVSGKNTGVVVIWAGRNNFNSPAQVKSDIAAMVAHLHHDRYLVLGILNREEEPKGTPSYATILELNKDLAQIYGSHYIDIRSVLVSRYDPNSAKEISGNMQDLVPGSLRNDAIHLNTEGNRIVAQQVAQWIRSFVLMCSVR